MMCRCFLLLLLMCGVGLGCETGVAFAGHSLSLYGSSLSNADVALLKSYGATDVNACMNDCCTEKYGACTVASFKKNATTGNNCRLFNCQPVQKCKFVTSASTDSFSFSSSTLPRILVPSSPRHASSENNSSSSTTTTTSTTTAWPTTVVALKDDNTTVVPRKGVDVPGLEDIFSPSNGEKSGGSKPRKGVSLEEGAKSSKVKPRKGVGPQPTLSSSAVVAVTTSRDHQEGHLVADDLVSALEKVFEDEAKQPVAPSPVDTLHPETTIRPSSSPVDHRDVIPTTVVHESLQPSPSSAADLTMTSGLLLPSLTTNLPLVTSKVAQTTPSLQTAGPVRTTPGVSDRATPTPSSPTILEHSRLIFHEDLRSSGEESESERKYKSSMHLVLSLVVGLLILVSVLGVVAKRIYDGWMRRHYRRMDFLIDGMYNGYG